MSAKADEDWNYFRVQSAESAETNKPAVLRIDDVWYDVTRWKHTHPGGARILDNVHGEDATDAFYSLHSQQAIDRLKNLPKAKPENIPTNLSTPKHLTAFREFRKQLEKDGWFERDLHWDLFYILQCFVLCGSGTYFSLFTTFWGHNFLAALLIGVGMQQAGWIGHDYGHGRDNGSVQMCYTFNMLSAGLINAFSPSWWSHKHNTHHCFPNVKETDLDIQNEPIFHLWFPPENEDTWIRQYQHLYFFPVVGVLYISWRIQSVQEAWAKKDWFMLSLMAINYSWLFLVLPWTVGLGAIYVGGFLVGVIVTASHQSEEIMERDDVLKSDYDFVDLQFRSTRDAYNLTWLTHYLWGGMQYQLVHHLFPIMPKYKYQAVRPLIAEFAKKNGLDYRVDSEVEIIQRNLDTLYRYSQYYKQKALEKARQNDERTTATTKKCN